MKMLYGQIYLNGRRYVAETPDGREAETSFATQEAAEHWLKMDDGIRDSIKLVNRRG